MKVLISLTLLFSILNAQFFGKTIKVSCADCQKPMRETIRFTVYQNFYADRKFDKHN